ncbi:MAG: hypothetical protein KDD11_18875 [Acidobacteria bacterium]|nr:hypothetical protein [Acidobacteriota bacterium]
MIELLVATMVLAIAVLIGLPELRHFYIRLQMETYVLDLSSSISKTRYEAIKRGLDTVVKADWTNRRFYMFLDQPVFDASGARTDTPWVFTPGEDEFLYGFLLPKDVEFASPAGLDAVEGLSDPVGADVMEDRVAIFMSDGSVQDVGSFRLGDPRTNFVQVAFNPQATGRVRLEKWDCVNHRWLDRADRWDWYTKAQSGC